MTGHLVWIGCLGVTLLVLFLFSGAFTASTSPDSSSRTLSDYTPAEMVTYLDRHDFDTSATARMQERLSRFSRNYGIPDIRVADKLVKTQELLADAGVHMQVGQIADSVEASTPRAGAISLDELLAAYVTLRSKNSAAETIARLHALLDELGLGMRPQSTVMEQRFQELGIASAEVGIALWGFDGFLRELTKVSGGR